ncbi:MAG TPA: type II secretion system F family protein [Tepidisphaeraceae bacterium]|jgi:tight adherence protein C|nr:type II secretion system F family protein [Tepidisphaeraceae bacterium]
MNIWSAIEPYILVISLFGFVALLVWWAGLMMMRNPGSRLRDRLKGNVEKKPEPMGKKKLGSIFQSVGDAAASPLMPKTREEQYEMKKRLAKAGVYAAGALRVMQGMKMILSLSGLVAGYWLGTAIDNVMIGIAFGGLLGFLAPSFWLRQQTKSHQRALERGLPDALDLLVICVEAGLTLDAAMQRVGQELSLAHPRLSRELEITHLETRLGLSRADSLKNLGERTGSSHLESLAVLLVQADRFGTSVASALRVHAESLRIQRQQAAEEQAAKASVKLTFPLVFFIFPAVLIVLAGPAAIGLFRSALFAE